jgi:hypothetical protein
LDCERHGDAPAIPKVGRPNNSLRRWNGMESSKRTLKPGKSCTFVGQWNALWLPKPDNHIATVVPHLFGRSTPRDTAVVPPTTLKRERSPEGLVGPVDPPANKRKRKRKRSKKVTPDQPGDVNQQYLWDLLLTV